MFLINKENSISLASIKWLLVLPIAFAIGLMNGFNGSHLSSDNNIIISWCWIPV